MCVSIVTDKNHRPEAASTWDGQSIPTRDEVLSEARRLDTSEYNPPTPGGWAVDGSFPPWYVYECFDSFEELYRELDGSWKHWDLQDSWTGMYDRSDKEYFNTIKPIFEDKGRFPLDRELEKLADVDDGFLFNQFVYRYFGSTPEVVDEVSLMRLCFAIRENVKIPQKTFSTSQTRTGRLFTGLSQSFLQEYLKEPHTAYISEYMEGTRTSRTYEKSSTENIHPNQAWAYDVLGIEKDASQEEISEAFRDRALETHPDMGDGDTESFKRVKEAYDLLSET